MNKDIQSIDGFNMYGVWYVFAIGILVGVAYLLFYVNVTKANRKKKLKQKIATIKKQKIDERNKKIEVLKEIQTTELKRLQELQKQEEEVRRASKEKREMEPIKKTESSSEPPAVGDIISTSSQPKEEFDSRLSMIVAKVLKEIKEDEKQSLISQGSYSFSYGGPLPMTTNILQHGMRENISHQFVIESLRRFPTPMKFEEQLHSITKTKHWDELAQSRWLSELTNLLLIIDYEDLKMIQTKERGENLGEGVNVE